MKDQDDAALRKIAIAGWDKILEGSEIFNSCGDVIKIDLASEEGEIEVFLDSSEISRILAYAFEKIPVKTRNQKECLASIRGILSKFPKIPIIIRPVVNKETLKRRDAFKI
jgi:hypothetical protein